MATQCIQQTIHIVLQPISLTVHTANNSYSIKTNMATQCIQQTIHIVLTTIWLQSAYSKQFIQY